MMDSDADSTYSSLIALPDWLLLAMLEAADPRSHRGDPPVFPVIRRRQAPSWRSHEPRARGDDYCVPRGSPIGLFASSLRRVAARFARAGARRPFDGVAGSSTRRSRRDALYDAATQPSLLALRPQATRVGQLRVH